MRFKEFLIFIIIFTILYFVSFAIYDYITNKKAVQKRDEDKEKLFNIQLYFKYAEFYLIHSTINEELLKKITSDLASNLVISLSGYSQENNISVEELIIIISFLEYEDLIPKRAVLIHQDCTTPLTEKDETLILKFSLLFINKYNYKTVLEKAGFNSDKEIEYLSSRNLLIGMKIIDQNLIYFEGDEND